MSDNYDNESSEKEELIKEMEATNSTEETSENWLSKQRDEISRNADMAMLDIFGDGSDDFGSEIANQEDRLSREFNFGEKLTGKVVAITHNAVLLDVQATSEGIIERQELEEDGELKLKVGDSVEAYFDGIEDGEILLTTKMRSQEVDTSALEHAFQNKIPIEGKVTGSMDAGLSVKLGDIRAFCPVSQIDIHRVDGTSNYVGQNLTFLIIEYSRGNVVLSRRQLIENEMEIKRDQLVEDLQEGAIIKGKVQRIMDFGVFVDIGGVDGLVPMSELSWERVEKAEDIVKSGDTVEVKVMSIDWGKNRISLSIKQAGKSPWDDVHKYLPGTKYPGVVQRLMPFGAFVQLEPGIEGLIHISKLGAGKRLQHAKEVLTVGQDLDVYVENIDTEEKRISLLLENSQLGRSMEVDNVTFTIGESIKGKVDEIRNYGVFVKLSEKTSGLLHVSEMNFYGNVNKVNEMRKRYPEGNEITVLVKEIHNNKISLTLPENKEDDSYKKFIKDEQKKSSDFGSIGGIFDNLDV